MNRFRNCSRIFKLLALLTCTSLSTLAQAQLGPSQLNISGGLYQSNGTAVTSTVDFKLEVMDKNATCVLYSEEHLSEDLNATKGRFSFEIGQGTSKSNKIDSGFPTALTSKIFQNPGAIAPYAGCAAGVNLNAGDNRMIRISYNVGAGYQTMNPDVPVSSSAFAMVADTLQGLTPSNFVQVRDDATYDLNQANVESIFSAANFVKLTALLSGNVSTQKLTNVVDPTAASDAATKGYVDGNLGGKVGDFTGVGPATGDGKTLIWDQAQNKWVTGTPVAVDASKLPLAGGTMTGAIAMGAQNITNIGHMTMAAQRTLNLGTYTDPQEVTLVAGLAAGDKGKIWFNTTSNTFKVWDGTAAINTSAPSGAAGGDLTGTYPNPTIDALAVDAGKIAASAVTTAKINAANAVAGGRLMVVDSIDTSRVEYKSCALNEVLRWEATGWTCVTAAVAIGTSGVTAATYGSATQVPQVAIDAQGRVTSASNVAITFPVVSVAGKTGAVTLNTGDLTNAGTAATKDFGAAAGNLVELDGGGKIPAGLLPTSAGDIQDVVAGSGLTGGGSSGAVTLSVDTGTTTGKIVQMAASDKLPAVDGSNLTGITASQISGSFANNGNSFGAAATLGTNDNFALNFEANSTTAMTILPTGNVGIGTTTPAHSLHVLGSGVTIQSSVATNTLSATSDNLLGNPQLSIINRAANGSQAGLHVYAGGENSGTYLSSGADSMGVWSAGAALYSVGTYRPTETTASALAQDNGDLTYSANTGLTVGTPGGLTERFRISASGNVGIGTTNPAVKLDVAGVIRATDICDEAGLNCKDISSGWGAGGDIDGVYAGTGLTGGFASGSGTLVVDVGTVAGKIVQLEASDKLPAVDGSNLTNLNVSGSNGFVQNGNSFGATAVLGTNDGNGLNFEINNAVRMAIDTSGNVGIGSTIPTARLDVAGTANFTGAVTVANNSSNGLVVGPNGTTNPVLRVNNSVASSATGILIQPAAAGSGVTIQATSSGANENLTVQAKGSGNTILNSSSQTELQASGTQKFIVTSFSMTGSNVDYFQFNGRASNTANYKRFNFVGAADTNLTASTEAPSTYFDMSQTRSHAPGAIALQRDFRISPSIHAFSSGSTITDAAGLSVDRAPNGGANATITNSSAIHVPTAALTNVTNSYGLNITAMSGAANNYAAVFNGGNVGIGTTSPSRLLHVNGPMRVTASALPGTPATGDIAVDSGDSNKLKWYNGSAWQAAGGSGGGGRTGCPAGFTLIGTSGELDAFCISTNEETSATWLNAVTACYNKSPKARLCSAGEWAMACVAGTPVGMTGNWEWVADLYANSGQVMGNSGCDSFSANLVIFSLGSRCCFR